MDKQRIFLSGATGTMGSFGLAELLKDSGEASIVVLARPSAKNKKLLAPHSGTIEIVWGDLSDYASIKQCVQNADIVLHCGAQVSPAADYNPRLTMEVNYGGTARIVKAIAECGQNEKTRFVYIGTVAETGDRMPPIHWGRVGDPIKPAVFDYYATSKTAGERAVIESDIANWVSLRQTGIMGIDMVKKEDAIIFHNGLDNVLEYASDRDSGLLLRNLCAFERAGKLGADFWGHIFNIGGGKECRASTCAMFQTMFSSLGIKKLSSVFDSKWFATRNFHGQYYLDSDKLENFLHFRSDTMQYLYDRFYQSIGALAGIARFITKLPGGEKMMAQAMRSRFGRQLRTEHGTMRFVEENMEDHIAAYWGSREAWEALPPLDEWQHFADWDKVVPISRGYDEGKSEAELGIADVKEAAKFRGGECLSTDMKRGDWKSKLKFRCGFGHEFEASPRLVLEGGHWCPHCERGGWNYCERAEIDPFFAQVWRPLHPKSEKPWRYPKIVTDADIKV